MTSYLERAQEHDEFMKTQHLDYQIGKRHLANMMGEDPETFTQEDIDVNLDLISFNILYIYCVLLLYYREPLNICSLLEFMIKKLARL